MPNADRGERSAAGEGDVLHPLEQFQAAVFAANGLGDQPSGEVSRVQPMAEIGLGIIQIGS